MRCLLISYRKRSRFDMVMMTTMVMAMGMMIVIIV